MSHSAIGNSGLPQGGATGQNATTEDGWPAPVSAIATGEELYGSATVEISRNHTLIVAGGRVIVVGRGKRGRLGLDDSLDRDIPTEIPGLSGVRDACAGSSHSVVLREDGSVWEFGDKSLHDITKQVLRQAEKDNGINYASILPTLVNSTNSFSSAEAAQSGKWDLVGASGWNGKVVGIACASTISAAWTDTGALYTWGVGRNGAADLCHHSERVDELPFPHKRNEAVRPYGVRTELNLPTQVCPRLFGNKKVVDVFAGGNELLGVLEDRRQIFLCGHREVDYSGAFGFQELQGKQSDLSALPLNIPLPSKPSALTFVTASLGWASLYTHLRKTTKMPFFIAVLEDELGRRRVFSGGWLCSVPKKERYECINEKPFADFGDLDVEEVSVRKKDVLLRLSDFSTARINLQVLSSPEADVTYPPPFFFDELRNITLKLPRTTGLGNSAMVLTKKGLLQTVDAGGQEGFTPVEKPLLARGAWCKVPPAFQWKKLHGFFGERMAWGWDTDKQGSSAQKRPRVPWGLVNALWDGRKGREAGASEDGRPVEKEDTVFGKRGPWRPQKMLQSGDTFEFKCSKGVLYPPSAAERRGSKCERATDGEEWGLLVPPLEDVECRGCVIPPAWDGGETADGSSLPMYVESVRRPPGLDLNGDPLPSRGWESFNTWKDVVEIGMEVRLRCPTGVLQRREEFAADSTCRVENSKEGPVAVFRPDNVVCVGCTLLPEWTEVPDAPFMPLGLEVSKAASRAESSSGGESDPGTWIWTPWNDNSSTILGVGDRVRFTCPSGELWAKTESEKEWAMKNGFECVWTERPNETFLGAAAFNLTEVKCKGCQVPDEWQRVGRPRGSRYPVDTAEIFRFGGESPGFSEEFSENSPVGVKDEISFRCEDGGVLRVWSGGLSERRATCVDPLRSPNPFDLKTSDVKCVRTVGETFWLVVGETLLALALSIAAFVLLWQSNKQLRRRYKMSRFLSYQRSVVPQEGSDVSDMRRENAFNIAQRDIRHRR